MTLQSWLQDKVAEQKGIGGPGGFALDATHHPHTVSRDRCLASKQFDNVKGLASEAIGDIADHVSEEGLTPSDLNAATEDFGRRVRKVAESATEAAFGRSDDKSYRNEKTVDAI
jgi:hypothetical protein